MVFPFRKILGRNSVEDAGGRIDRALTGRTKRLMVGLDVDAKFERLAGALIVAEGHGKFMRVEYATGITEKVSDSLKHSCLALTSNPQVEHKDAVQCAADLADLQATVFDQLKRKAGKYVDRVLAVAVTDPGLWFQDFDSNYYSGLCDASRLAEISGATVIDSFPAQDVAVRGRGGPLSGLPSWILMSDRNRHTATSVNAAMILGSSFEGYLLPPSDGLDATIPPIETVRSVGIKFIEALVGRMPRQVVLSHQLNSLLLAGVHNPKLLSRWKQIKRLHGSKLVDNSTTSGSSEGLDDSESPALIRQLVEEAIEFSQNSSSVTVPFENVISTALEWIISDCKTQVSEGLESLRLQYELDQERIAQKLQHVNAKRRSNAARQIEPDFSKIGKVLLSTKPAFESVFLTKLQNAFPESEIGLPHEFIKTEIADRDGLEFDAVLTAILGLMHVDQMPGNLPNLTGGSQQRILGRLTPGRPHQWRQLLREMADFQPAAMKLKDAI